MPNPFHIWSCFQHKKQAFIFRFHAVGQHGLVRNCLVEIKTKRFMVFNFLLSKNVESGTEPLLL